MRLRPLQDRVLIRRAEPEFKTSGDIFIPDNVQEKPVEGYVVAVGPGVRGSGTEVKIEGEELMIIKEADIMGVIEHAVSAKQAA